MKKGLLSILMAVFCLWIMFGQQARAEEPVQGESTIEQGQIMIAEKAVDARQEPDDNSDIVTSFDAGAPVFVIGEAVNGWYKISYQGKEGYIRKTALIDTDLDIAALDDEMEAVSLESKMVVEEVERYRAEVKRSRMWGTIIILLIVGIFAVGIFSVVKAKKGSEEEKKEEKVKEEEFEEETIEEREEEEIKEESEEEEIKEESEEAKKDK